MRLFVIGGTGRTGQALVAQAAGRGHSVTTFGRSKQNQIAGSPFDPDQLAQAMRGHDAVLSAIGSGGLGRTTVRTDSARATIAAMERAALQRFIVLSSTLVDDHPDLFTRIFSRTLARAHAADQRDMEKIIAASQVDWTIIRPPGLTNGPLTSELRAATTESGRYGRASRNDVARVMLDIAESGAFKRQITWLA